MILTRHVLSFMPALMFGGAVVSALIPKRRVLALRSIGLFFSFLVLLVSLLQLILVNASGEFDFQEFISWIPALGINLRFGVDGVSSVLVASLSFVLFMGAVFSARIIDVRVKEYFIMYLVTGACLIGAAISLNVIQIAIFLQISVATFSFMAGMWGDGDRIRGFMRLFIVLEAACLLLFYCFIRCGIAAKTFDVIALYGHDFGAIEQRFLFSAMCLGFLVLAASFPFSSWLSSGIESIPLPVGMCLAGTIPALGLYGIYRLGILLFPLAASGLSEKAVSMTAAIFVLSTMFLVSRGKSRAAGSAMISALGVFGAMGFFSGAVESVLGATVILVMMPVLASGMLVCEFYSHFQKGAVLKTFIACIMLAVAVFPMFGAFYGFVGVAGGVFQKYQILAIFVLLGYVFLLAGVLKHLPTMIKNPEGPENLKSGIGDVLVVMPFAAVGFFVGVYPNILVTKMAGSAAAFVELMKRYELVIPAGIIN